MDISAGPVSGRPHGGVVTLYRKSISKLVEQIPTASKRLCVIRLESAGASCILVNCYFPCDERTAREEDLLELAETLSAIEGIILEFDGSQIILCGDLNSDFSRHSLHVEMVREFLLKYDLDSDCNSVDYTFESYDGRVRSKIDHIVHSTRSSVFSCNPVNVYHTGDNLSCHSPMHTKIACSFAPAPACCHNPGLRFLWSTASEQDICNYKSQLHQKITSIKIPHHLMSCSGSCRSVSHRHNIDNYVAILMTCILSVCYSAVPRQRHSPNRRLMGWTTWGEPLRRASVLWHTIWVAAGRPLSGILADIRRRARKRYHSAVRALRAVTLKLSRDNMAQNMLHSAALASGIL